MEAEVLAYDAAVEERYPELPWRTPILIHIGDYEGLACRLCIARLGFKAKEDRDRLYRTWNEFHQHMRGDAWKRAA